MRNNLIKLSSLQACIDIIHELWLFHALLLNPTNLLLKNYS